MHPLRIAILIFVVVASIANYFATMKLKEQLATSSPSFQLGTEFTEENLQAWLREAGIVTIGGVAWYVAQPKAT
jgi:hypothetical protein